MVIILLSWMLGKGHVEMAHIEKYKSEALGGMLGHYERWGGDAEKLAGRSNIDPKLTHFNYNLGPVHGCSQLDFIEGRIASLNLKRKPRKDAVRMCDCVLTMPRSLDPARRDEFFRSAYGFLAHRYGEKNVVSAWVHLDEPDAQPHMHFAWVPVTDDGRLSAKDVCKRADLRTLHTDMQNQLEAELGCPVEVLLGDEKQGEKQLSHLNQKEYRAAKKRLTELHKEVEQETRRLEGVRRTREAAERRVGALESVSAACHAIDDAEPGAKVGLLGTLVGRCLAFVREVADQLPRRLWAALQRGNAHEVSVTVAQVLESGAGARGGERERQLEMQRQNAPEAPKI